MSEKDLLLADMKINPMNYSREDMYRIICDKKLTEQELVINSNILTNSAYKRILRYPKLSDEQRQLPISILSNPQSEEGNIDVYFIGISGSGKSNLLGSLMAQAGCIGFSFDPRGNSGAGNYAMELRNYARCAMLPPAEDQEYIQLIDCEIFYPECRYFELRWLAIEEKPYVQKFSFIELSGIKIAEMLSKGGNVSLKDLGSGAEDLLKNNNPKLIFFVIDPVNEKRVKIGDRILTINQSDMISKVSNLLCSQKGIRQRIAQITIILSKSDLLGCNIDQGVVNDCLESQNYQYAISDLKDLCKEYGINGSIGFQVAIIPYTIGNFMPGEVYTANDEDALKILRRIRRHCICGLNHRKERQSKFEIFMERIVVPWLNK